MSPIPAESTSSGLRRRQANIAGLKVISTCLLADPENRPVDSAYKVRQGPETALGP